jgi:hypothetical protein
MWSSLCFLGFIYQELVGAHSLLATASTDALSESRLVHELDHLTL